MPVSWGGGACMAGRDAWQGGMVTGMRRGAMQAPQQPHSPASISTCHLTLLPRRSEMRPGSWSCGISSGSDLGGRS